MVRCLVNFAIGPAVKLNQDPHKIITVWFVSRKVRSLALDYTCLLHGMKLGFLCKVKELEGTTFSILLSLFSLPAISARCITNPSWGLFLRDSAIKLQKQSNPSSWAKNWQQMSTNPVDHGHIYPQGGLTPHLPLWDDH